jgi:hypothetical protein
MSKKGGYKTLKRREERERERERERESPLLVLTLSETDAVYHPKP